MLESKGTDMAEMDTKALRNVSYGLYIVTSGDARRRNGQIANTSFQVTSQPATVAVSINKQNLTHEIIEQCQVFGVSVLEESTPMPFIGLFGFKSGRDLDKFASVQTDAGATGCPLVIDHAIAVLEAKVVGKLDAGSHTVFLGELVSCRVLKKAEPLTYAKYHQNKGKEPKTAPTYRPPEPAAAGEQGSAPARKYVCRVCGWVYDPTKGDSDGGIAAGTPFEQIPDSWVCPVCGAGKAEFSLQ